MRPGWHDSNHSSHLEQNKKKGIFQQNMLQRPPVDRFYILEGVNFENMNKKKIISEDIAKKAKIQSVFQF